jgi:hypothetical protein
MPADSVDNYWLTVALWGGLPSLILLILAIVALLRAVNRYTDALESPEARGCRYGWTAAILAMCVMGASVHWWGALALLFAFYLGAGGCLADLRSGEPLRAEGRPKAARLRRRRGAGGGVAVGGRTGGERTAADPDRGTTT